MSNLEEVQKANRELAESINEEARNDPSHLTLVNSLASPTGE